MLGDYNGMTIAELVGIAEMVEARLGMKVVEPKIRVETLPAESWPVGTVWPDDETPY